MHLPKKPSTSRGREKHQVALLVLPDSVPMEVMIAQQIFGQGMGSGGKAVGEVQTPYEVVLCAEAERLTLASGVDLGELAPLDAILSADTVIVPGVNEPLAPRSDTLLSHLSAAHATGTRMVSFCGGAFLLGQAGVLDDRRATTHWLYAEEFRRSFPRVVLEPERLYVDDGPVHTSGGIFSATDLALHLIALDLGQVYANDLGRILVAAPHRYGGQAQFIKASLHVDHISSGPFLDWLREHLHEPLSLGQLAEHEHMSERSLIRKFKDNMGMSIFDWINQERVQRAKVLLEATDYRVTEIATMVGFGSSETLRRNFVNKVGVSTGSYRSAFRSSAAATPSAKAPVTAQGSLDANRC